MKKIRIICLKFSLPYCLLTEPFPDLRWRVGLECTGENPIVLQVPGAGEHPPVLIITWIMPQIG